MKFLLYVIRQDTVCCKSFVIECKKKEKRNIQFAETCADFFYVKQVGILSYHFNKMEKRRRSILFKRKNSLFAFCDQDLAGKTLSVLKVELGEKRRQTTSTWPSTAT